MKRLLVIILSLITIQLSAQEKVGINTTSPDFTLDVRSTNDINGAAIIQLATPSRSNWLTLFAGHQTDPRPFMYFSNLDTFRIATGNDDYSAFTEHLVILPDGKTGINSQTGAYTSITDIFQVFADDTVVLYPSIYVNDITDLPAIINSSTSFGQSVQSEVDGSLSSFNFVARCVSGGSSVLQYTIRSGSIVGPALATGTVSVFGSSYAYWNVNPLGVSVTNGTKYYLTLDYVSGDDVDWGYSVNDGYAPGESYSNQEGPWSIFGSSDFASGFFFLTTGVNNTPIFTVENEARVKVHDYRLPDSDGSAGQVMTTDGSGELSWSNDSGGSGGGAFVNIANLIRHTGNQMTDDFIFGDTTLINPTQNSFFFDKSKGAFRIGYPDVASLPINVGDFSFASGFNVMASGHGAMAVGKDLVASGDHSSAFGESTKSNGSNSVSAGLSTTAFGTNSFAIGDTTGAYERNAAAFGQMTVASEKNAFSGGERATASGKNSFAFGFETIATASNTSAFGLNTQANSIASFAVGMNNHPVINFPSDDIAGNYPLFMVGNGETNSVEDWSNAMTVLVNGNTGLGLNDPISTLHLNDYDSRIILEATGGFPILQFTDNDDPMVFEDWKMYASFFGSGSFRLEQDGIKRWAIDGSGHMAVGNIEPQAAYRLAVDGSIITEEVRVQLKTDWPDYVFSDEYELLSLEKTEAYISNNNHLPNIPDAQTVKEKGIELGDMQKMMMEKIEELTLHVIELNKRIKELESNRNPSK